MFRVVKAIKGAYKWNRAIDLASKKKNIEALKELNDIKKELENRDYEYHILKGRLLAVTEQTTEAIENLNIAENLLTSDKKLSDDNSSYLFAYISYIREMFSGEAENSTKIVFNLKKVSNHLQIKYPIR